VFLLPQSTAAAVGAGLPVGEPVASMVCDLGAGTSEVAVISLGDVVASCSVRTGGQQMDQAVVDHLRRNHNLRIGLPAAERLRVEIGDAYPTNGQRAEEVRGLDVLTGLPRKLSVTSGEVRQALAGPLEAILDGIRQTLDQLPPELAADLMDTGLLLSGGASLTPGIDRFIAEKTGLPVRVVPDPLAAVAEGALVCLENLDRWRSALESSDDEA
jgi:rod shape-determining protein MreB